MGIITPTQRLRELEQQEATLWNVYMRIAATTNPVFAAGYKLAWRKTMDEIVELKQQMGEPCEPS